MSTENNGCPAVNNNLPMVETVSVAVRHPPHEDIYGFLCSETCRLLRLGILPDSIVEVLTEARDTWWNPRRPIRDREISETVKNMAARLVKGPVQVTQESVSFAYDPVKGWPEHYHLCVPGFNPAAVEVALASSEVKSVADLVARSCPVPRAPVRHLFKPDMLLCTGLASDKSTIKPVHEWSDAMLENCQFVVPNEMRSTRVVDADGKWQFPRRRVNVGPRRFLVLESDNASLSKDQKASVLWAMGEGAPLVAVVDSGGKSLHGWYYVENANPDGLREWFRTAVSLGCDSVTWKPEQYVRMPSGTRRKEGSSEVTEQKTIYFNPSILLK